MGGMRGPARDDTSTPPLRRVQQPSPRRDAPTLPAEFHVLGPLRVLVAGTEVPIATRRQRALLDLLLLHAGQVVPADRLIDQLWDGSPPPQAAVTLRSYVSNVRQALGGPAGLGSALVTRAQGYALEVPGAGIDADRLARLGREGRELLRQERPEEALERFDAAVRLWRGEPFTELADHEAVRNVATALREQYLAAVEGRFEALLAVGRHADALPDLEVFVAEHPMREEPVGLLMLALYRAGRASEALEAHRRLRLRLDEELGIDPSQHLGELYRRILERDPTLTLHGAAGPRSTPPESGHDAERPRSPAKVVGPSARSGAQPVVGREHELAAVRASLDALERTGTGALLLLSGEPGIGKSTLLEALEEQARHRGFGVHSGRSPAATGAPPFWPWLQVLGSIAGELDDEALQRAVRGPARAVAQLSPAVAERTGQALPLLGHDPQAMRFHLYEAVSVFLGQASPARPLVITLDDLHWADSPSLELLSYLAPSVASRPLMLVAAYRDLPADRTDALDATLATVSREDVAHELALAGLGRSEVADLVDTLLQEAGPDTDRNRLAALLHERTGGNPFFIRQLARLVLDGGREAADRLSMPAPPGVRHVIARRIAALPQRSRTLLAAAAVIGRDFDLRRAAGAAGMDIDEALDAFDDAATHGLVEVHREQGADRRFVHALVQEVMLDGLPAGRAARLHAAVAARLEAEGAADPDELARHLWAARDVTGAAAVPALVAAAERAAGVFALDQAEVHLRRALELVRAQPAGDPSTELSLLLGLFRLILTGRGWGDQDGRTVIDRAMELAGSGGFTGATTRLWWSMIFYLIDRNDPAYAEVADRLLAAVEEADRSAQEAEPPDGGRPADIGHDARAVVHLAYIYSALHAGDRETAYRHLRTARAHVDAAAPEDLAAFDEHLHVMMLLIEGSFAAMTGDQDRYLSTTSAAIALADADGRPFPRAVARTLAVANGVLGADPDFVEELAREAADLNARFGFAWLGRVVACVQAWVRGTRRAGDAGAVDLLESQLADMIEQGRWGTTAIVRVMLGDVHRLQGRPEAARAVYLAARATPGPYRDLMVDLIDERLHRIERA